MSSRRFVVRGSLVAFMLSLTWLAAVSAVEQTAEPWRGGWNEARTAHFTVVAEEKGTAQKSASRLESFAAVFADRGHPIPGNGTVRVVVAPSDKVFRELAGPTLKDSDSYVGAALLSAEHPTLLVHLDARTEDATATIYRAYVQLSLGLDASTLPVWFREGMAEYYRTFGITSGTAIVGRAVKEHVYLLRNRAFMPWEEFFTCDRERLDAYPRDKRELFQAQAWLVVHAQFAAGDEGKHQLSTLLDIRDEAHVAPVVEKAWKTDLEGATARMRDYLKQDRLSYRHVEVVVPPPPEVKLAKVSGDDVRTWFTRARESAKEIAGIKVTPSTDVRYEYPVGPQPTGR